MLRRWSSSRCNNSHRWLWAPAFAGATSRVWRTYRLICAFSVSSTTRSNDDAFGGALARCVGDVFVALGHQRSELVVQCLALVHLLVDFVHALLRLHRPQIVRQILILDRREAAAAGGDVGDEIAIAGDGFRGRPGALVDVARHLGGLRGCGGRDLRQLLGLVFGALLHRARAVGDHGAVDLALQDDDVLVIGRLDDDDLAAVLRDRNEAAIAVLGDVAPHPLGVARRCRPAPR